MFFKNSCMFLKKSLIPLATAALLAACGSESPESTAQATASKAAQPAEVHAEHAAPADAQKTVAVANSTALDVYKSETCGCCGAWIEYMEGRDFEVSVHHPADLNAKKQELGVEARYQSCHTAVSAEGYVFEGHIPASVVSRFLEEKPEDAIGLAVPGMPVGSPGMEVGDRFAPYDVVLLKKDGTSEVYASIASAAEQR